MGVRTGGLSGILAQVRRKLLGQIRSAVEFSVLIDVAPNRMRIHVSTKPGVSTKAPPQPELTVVAPRSAPTRCRLGTVTPNAPESTRLLRAQMSDKFCGKFPLRDPSLFCKLETTSESHIRV